MKAKNIINFDIDGFPVQALCLQDIIDQLFEKDNDCYKLKEKYKNNNELLEQPIRLIDCNGMTSLNNSLFLTDISIYKDEENTINRLTTHFDYKIEDERLKFCLDNNIFLYSRIDDDYTISDVFPDTNEIEITTAEYKNDIYVPKYKKITLEEYKKLIK